MAAADEQATTETRPTGIGPGERLQAARIQRGLSIDDVAGRMHLSISILEAIEENNFEEITAPIFVKGYLRAYARIVLLDEDDMIRQYSEYYSEEDPPISSTSSMVPELSVGDVRIKWTTYLVILVLAALLAVWWWNKGQNEEAPISLDSQSTDAEASARVEAEVIGTEIEAVSESTRENAESTEAAMQPAAPEAPAQIEPTAVATVEPTSVATVEPIAVDMAEPTAVDTAEPTAVDTAEPEPVEAESGNAEPDATVALQQPASATTSAGETDTGAVEAVPGSRDLPSLLAPTGADKLRVIVNADTWADIKDSSGYQLVYDLLRADQAVEMTGAAPFSVFLGNGHGVEILLNDEEVNFSFRIRDDNTARLRIGG